MERLAGRGIRFVVDAEGALLTETLPFRPFLIKPNRAELEGIVGRELADGEELKKAAAEMQQRGAMNVLVSLGGDGCLLLDENQKVYTMPAPQGTAVNTVGAGDSMIAGFLAGLQQKSDYAYALKLGTACGGATAFSKDLADATTIEQVFSTLADPKHDQ
jgi:1-phosphofructokinase